MPKIVISYRRADSDAISGRIRDRLASHFGEDSIFMDIDSIPFGTDFRDYIRDALFDSDILVAIVGPKWLGPGEGTHLRIKEENDPIRIEVETALNRGISVIPVLVNGAIMPKPSELPATLENFAFRNAAEVDSGRDFHPHLDRLIRSIEHILQAKGKLTGGGMAGSSTAASAASLPQAVAAAPIHRPPETEPAAPGYAPSPPSAGSMSASELIPPAAKPKRRRTMLALVGGGAAIAAAIAGFAAWYFGGLPISPVTPDQPVIAQPQTPTRPPTTPAVVAGCPGTPAFHDDFKTPDQGWDLGKAASFSDGQLVVKAPADTWLAVLYRSLIYKNATICLDVKTPPAMNSPDYGGGLIFWATDYNNYYRVLVTIDGRYHISRRVNGTWRTITPFTRFDGLKQGYGVVNRIKVTTAGSIATVYLNDRKVQDIKSQPPRSGGSVGVFGTSEKDQANEWGFLAITVVELPASQTVTVPPSEASTKAMLASCKLGSAAVFADDFKVRDPSWNGLDDGEIYYANGRLTIKPQENKVGRVLNFGLVYNDISICADVISPAEIKDEKDTAAGIIFWASGFTSNYYARVFPDGSYSINRIVDGTFFTVAPKTTAAAVNKGPGAENWLKVVLNKAFGTLYINDVKVREFRGQPPPDGSSFGLYADSEAKHRAEWGFGGIVVTEP